LTVAFTVVLNLENCVIPENKEGIEAMAHSPDVVAYKDGQRARRGRPVLEHDAGGGSHDSSSRGPLDGFLNTPTTGNSGGSGREAYRDATAEVAEQESTRGALRAIAQRQQITLELLQRQQRDVEAIRRAVALSSSTGSADRPPLVVHPPPHGGGDGGDVSIGVSPLTACDTPSFGNTPPLGTTSDVLPRAGTENHSHR
jgi:hypothetical protein